ncbi:hypothetical protein STEG23_003019, partial [Scotinomys teguina]
KGRTLIDINQNGISRCSETRKTAENKTASVFSKESKFNWELDIAFSDKAANTGGTDEGENSSFALQLPKEWVVYLTLAMAPPIQLRFNPKHVTLFGNLLEFSSFSPSEVMLDPKTEKNGA